MEIKVSKSKRMRKINIKSIRLEKQIIVVNRALTLNLSLTLVSKICHLIKSSNKNLDIPSFVN